MSSQTLTKRNNELREDVDSIYMNNPDFIGLSNQWDTILAQQGLKPIDREGFFPGRGVCTIVLGQRYAGKSVLSLDMVSDDDGTLYGIVSDDNQEGPDYYNDVVVAKMLTLLPKNVKTLAQQKVDNPDNWDRCSGQSLRQCMKWLPEHKQSWEALRELAIRELEREAQQAL